MSTDSSMTTSLRRHADQEDLCNPDEPYYKRRSSFFGHVTGYYNTDNNHNNDTKQTTTEKSHDDSWSIKKFLSRHVSSSRRYRVLERGEPNRLRKRFTQ
ncbi:hypothetical protein ASPBRDRAFT_478787 [Aspergillus brasiliensis CBS 101740]|uniref:Uncharacterized protein n=1 Tax=Aspergillus brasiliensis (strain CBS 101740 / IMI 381727 / IBT 21946) TaxID=767769 RepID=A0A1L9UU94_ASPBC|nr:hypothetical protein ASPBRDRAFT_478787 [Aspergillus brasiliensis CBS 101740]